MTGLVNAVALLKVLEIKPAEALAATDSNDTGVDISDADGPVLFILTGKNTSGTGTYDVKIQESDQSGSGFTDVPGGAFTQIAGSGAGAVSKVTLDGRALKKFVRAVATLGGTATTIVAVSAAYLPKYR